jgi:hypothetical protein
MKTGIELIAEERAEQVTKHHINTGMDVLHNSKEQLRMGAMALLEDTEIKSTGSFPMSWDEDLCMKMIVKPYKERLIIAGALIAAEIDRLQSLEK